MHTQINDRAAAAAPSSYETIKKINKNKKESKKCHASWPIDQSVAYSRAFENNNNHNKKEWNRKST